MARHAQNRMTAPSQMHAPVKASALNSTNGKLLAGCSPARRGKTSDSRNWNRTEADTHKGSNHPAEKIAIRICFTGSIVRRIGERVVRKVFAKRQSFVLTVRVAMPNARHQRRAAKGLSTTLDFIASPLHRLVLRLFTHRRPDAPSGFP